MNCTNCGNELSPNAQFCSECGAPVKREKKSILTLVKNKWVISLAGIILAVLVIFIILFSNSDGKIKESIASKDIDICDYINISVYGLNGQGTLIESFDYERLAAETIIGFPDKGSIDDGLYTSHSKESLVSYYDKRREISDAFEISADKTSNLSNGDIVTITVTVSDVDVLKSEGYKQLQKNYTKKIEFGTGEYIFPEPVIINPFDFFVTDYYGVDQYGRLAVSRDTLDTEIDLPFLGKTTLAFEFYSGMFGNTYTISLFDDDYSFKVDFSKTENLSNGEIITITLSSTSSKIALEEKGVFLSELSHSYTVSGLATPVSLDLQDIIPIQFNGYNGCGTISFLKDSNVIDFKVPGTDSNTITLQYTTGSSYDRLYISCEDFEDSLTIRYASYDALKNGDTITLTIDEDDIARLKKYGLIISNNHYSYTISGLIDPYILNLSEHLSFSIGRHGSLLIDKTPITLNVDVPGIGFTDLTITPATPYITSQKAVYIQFGFLDAPFLVDIYCSSYTVAAGDIIIISFDEDDAKRMHKYGVILSDLRYKYTVTK